MQCVLLRDVSHIRCICLQVKKLAMYAASLAVNEAKSLMLKLE